MRKLILVLTLILMLSCCCFATVPAGESIRQYFAANGSTTTFTFTQPVNSGDDIKVLRQLLSTGVETELVEGSTYEIAATGGDFLNGGVVTITPALASTFRVVIVREIKKSQETTSGAISSASAALALDKLTRIVQDLEDRRIRSVHLQESDPDQSMELPPLTEGFIAINDNNEIIISTSVSAGSISVSSFMETVLDDASALAAMNTLSGIPVINVKSDAYGAKGDGDGAGNGTDDFTAIAAAFADANGTGVIVFFPSGEYLTSAKLTLPRECIIMGTGTGVGGTTIQLLDSAGNAEHVFERNFATLTSDSSVSIVIANMRIKGNWDGATSAGTGDGIHFEYVNVVIMDNVIIQDCTGDGLYFSRPAYFYLNNIQPRSNRLWGMEVEDHGGSSSSTTSQIRGRSIFNGNGATESSDGGAIKLTNINKFIVDGAVIESNRIFLSLNGTSNNSFTIQNCYTEFQTSDDTLIDMSSASARKVAIVNNYLGGKANFVQLIKPPADMSGDIVEFAGNHLTATALDEPEKFSVSIHQEDYSGSGHFITAASTSPATIATFIIGASAVPATSQGIGNFEIGIAGTDQTDLKASSSQILHLHIASSSTLGLRATLHAGIQSVAHENEPVFYENEEVTVEGALSGDFGVKVDGVTVGFTNPTVTVSGDRIVSLQITPDDASGVFGRVWWRGASFFNVSGSTLEKPIRIQAWTIDETGGQHDTGASAATLVDSGESFTDDEFIGKYLFNITDNSFGFITSNDSTSITATLEGGTDNDWDVGDFYEVRTFNR